MSDESKEQSKPSEEEEQGEKNTKKVPSLWRIGGYRMWFTADTALALGSSMRDVVIALVAYSLSHSLVWSGMLATARELVILAMATVGGTVVDRHPRKKLVLIDVWCNMVVWGVVTALMVAGWLTFPMYVAALLAAAVVNGLLGHATDAMLRSIVPTVAFAKAQAVNEGRDSAVELAGGPLGGAIYAVQTWLPFLSSVVMYAIAGVSVLQVKIDESALKRSSDDENGASGRNGVRGFAADFVGGWRWFFLHQTPADVDGDTDAGEFRRSRLIAGRRTASGVRGHECVLAGHAQHVHLRGRVLGVIDRGQAVIQSQGRPWAVRGQCDYADRIVRYDGVA